MSDFIPDFALDLGASVSIGEATEPTQVDEKAWKEWVTPRLLYPKFSIATINGNAAVRAGEGPNTNRRWLLTRFVCASATPVGAAAIASTKVYLFRDQGGRGLVTPSNFEAMELLWAWDPATFPIIQNWNRDQICVVSPEDLIVVINSAAVNNISGNVQVIDEPIMETPLYSIPWK